MSTTAASLHNDATRTMLRVNESELCTTERGESPSCEQHSSDQVEVAVPTMRSQPMIISVGFQLARVPIIWALAVVIKR